MVTWSQVLERAPELSNAASLQDTQTQNDLIAEAYSEMNTFVWANQLDRGAVYLIAHLATCSLRRGAGGAIEGVTAGAAKIQYAAGKALNPADLGSTSYGTQFERIMKQLPSARFGLAGFYP
jgi:hypothetical protein